MKRLLLATAFAVVSPAVASSAHLIEITSVSQFDDLLKQNNKVIVDFWAEWCGPCKMLLPIINKLGNESTDIMYLKVKHDRDPRSAFAVLAKRYKVQAFPTLIAIKDCCKAAESVGYKAEAALRNWIKSVLP